MRKCFISIESLEISLIQCQTFFFPLNTGGAAARSPQLLGDPAAVSGNFLRCKDSWWIIPRIVSRLFHPNYKWINPRKIPLITGDITYLLSGMIHQVPPKSSKFEPFSRFKPIVWGTTILGHLHVCKIVHTKN